MFSKEALIKMLLTPDNIMSALGGIIKSVADTQVKDRCEYKMHGMVKDGVLVIDQYKKLPGGKWEYEKSYNQQTLGAAIIGSIAGGN